MDAMIIIRGGRRTAALLALAALVGAAAGALAAPRAGAAADLTRPTNAGPPRPALVTSSSVTLSWARATDDVRVEGYRIYRGPAGAPRSTLVPIATTEAPGYAAYHLRSDTAYTFGVLAFDATGNESPSMVTVDVRTAPSGDTTPPDPPRDSSVSARAFSGTRIDIVWSPSGSPDVSGYRIERDGVQIGALELPGGLRFSDVGLEPASTHTYVIRTVDPAGNVSAGTAPRTATTLPADAVRIARGPYVSRVTATSAIVSWWTNLESPGVVHFGVISPGERDAEDPDGVVRLHEVHLTGLTPGTRYAYQVQSGDARISGSFATAAPPGTRFSFAAIGDFGGGGPGERATAGFIAAAGTSFIQTLGDNIYPSTGGDPGVFTRYADYDARFFGPFAQALRVQAFYPANGVAEYHSRPRFWATFPMLGLNQAWYGYDWGDAHLTVLDSEQPIGVGSDQYQFAEADLAAHQDAVWRIVVLYRPPHTSARARSVPAAIRTDLVPLLERLHVQLVLSGGSHDYERSHPLIGDTVTPGGITYVVSGAGGNGLTPFDGEPPPWSAAREAVAYEFAKVSVAPDALRIEAIEAGTGAVLDSVTLTPSTPALRKVPVWLRSSTLGPTTSSTLGPTTSSTR